MAAGAVVARILTLYSDKGSKQAQKDIAKLGKQIDAFGKKALKSFGLAAAATSALAVKIGKDSVKAAIEDNKSQAALAKTLYSTVGATDAVIASVEDYIGKQQMLANVSDTVLRASFAKLVMSAGDVESAMAEQTLALDIAAGTGKDVVLVSDAIAKAQQGNFAALKKLIPTLDASIVKNKDLGAALLYANKMFRGQAEAAAKTDPLTRLNIAYGELQEKLGNVLLPTVAMFVEYLVSDVFPQLEYWIYLNENRISGALDAVVGNIKELVVAFTNIYNVIQGINNLLPIGIGGWIQLAVAIKALTLIASISSTGLAIYSMRLSLLTGSMQIFGKSTDSVKTILGSSANNQMKMILLSEKLKLALFGTAAAGTKLGIALRFIGKMMLAILPKPIWLLFAAIAAVAVVAKKVFKVGDGKNVLSEAAQEAEYSMWKAAKATESMDDAVGAYRKTQEKLASKTKEQIEYERILALQKAKSAAATKRQEAAEALRTKVLARLKKLNATPGKSKDKIGKGITPFSTLEAAEQEAINFRAAELLLLKAKDNAAETEKLKKLRERIVLQEIANKLADRYNDILIALADNSISDKDIVALAGKWKTTTDIAKMYVQQVLGLGSIDTNEAKVAMLMTTWDMTNKQAKMYIDFTDLIKRGNYSTADIERVGAAHGLNAEEAKKYYTYYKLIMDGELSDADILAIKVAYKDTNIQIVEMIEKLGVPVKVTGNILDATLIARLESHWIKAKAAMDDYYKAMNGYNNNGIQVPTIIPPVVTGCPTGSTLINGKCTPIVNNPVVVDPGTKSDGNKIKALEEAISLEAYAKAKAAGDMNAAAIAAAGVNPSALAAQENGIIGAASIAAKLKAAEDANEAASAAARQASSLAAFRDKEARDLAASQAASAQLDIDERAKFRAAQGVMASAGNSGFKGLQAGGNTNVYLTVNGSVSTENDLVQTVRNGLLRGQINGQTLTLEAV